MSEAPSKEVFVHRDFHPGNVLWRRAKVTGLRGRRPLPGNLLRYGLEVADRFISL